MNSEPSNVFTGRPFSLLVRPSDITAPPVHNMNRFNPYTSAEKVDLGQELIKLREESVNLPPLPVDSEQLRVYVRLRPTDLGQDQIDKTYRIEAGQRLYVSATNAGATAEHELRFSHVFSCKATQQEVFFGAARPLVFNFIGGDNALIFAYGCTSSGKTFTIEGTHDNPGVLPRCIQTIFCQLNVVEQHRLLPVRFNEFQILSSRQADAAAAEKAALFSKIHAEVKNVHFEQDPSTSCFFPDVLQHSGRQCSLFMGFVEIYNNNVYDLLGPSMQSSENLQPFASKNAKQNKNPRVGKAKQPTEPREALQVGEDAAHNTYVKELRWVQVGSAQEALELVAFAQRNMTFASTFFNMNSSRSHVICFTRLAYWNVKVDIDDSMAICDTTGSYLEEQGFQTLEVDKSSVMAICDLAGSERQPNQHQGPTGFDRLREAGSINTDLLTLGQCLTGMHNNQIASRKLQVKQNLAAGAAAVVAKKKPTEEPVPYRSCRLTYLLKAFLVGGRARVAMISAIVPTVELMEQNLQVLRYAAFASEVVVYRKLEPSVIEKFQKAKQKQQSIAVAKAARRLSQAPKGRAALAATVTKKGRHPVSEGTPITEELVKIQEEMGDALDAQMVVMESCGFQVDNDSDEDDDETDDDEDDDDEDEEDGESEDDEECDAGEQSNLSKAELVKLLRGVCEECKKLHEENKNLKQAKDNAELEAKRQRGYYEMVKERYKEAVEEIQELRTARPSIDQCIGTETVTPMFDRPSSFKTQAKPTMKEDRSGLMAALGLAEPSLRWQNSQKMTATTLWADDESVSKEQPKRKIDDQMDAEEAEKQDRCTSPTSPMLKRSRLETPLAPPSSAHVAPLSAVSEHRLKQDRGAASPSTMPINKFSTHTKASILRMRMHQANVVKERHNAVHLKTPVLHPTNPEDLSLDEAVPHMPAEMARRLEQIQMLKHTLGEVEQQRDALQRQLEEVPSLEKYRRQEESLLKMRADLEFEKQLCQQNASEAETLRCQNVELMAAFDAAKKTEESLADELVSRKEEIARLKERISELQHDLQVVYEELNGSRAEKTSESMVFNDQLDSVRKELSKKEAEMKAAQLESAQKFQELEALKVQLRTTQAKLAEIEKERQTLLEEDRKRQERGNTTCRMEDLQFDVDEANLELETARSRVRTLEETTQTQSVRLQELERQLLDKSSEVCAMRTRLEDLENISKTLEQITHARDDAVANKLKVAAELEHEISSVRSQLKEKCQETDRLKDNVVSLEKSLGDLKETMSATDSQVMAKLRSLETAHENALAELAAKSSEAASLESKVAELERAIETLKDVEAAYEKTSADLSEKSTEVKSLHAKITEMSQSAKESTERLQSEVDSLKSEIDRLANDLTTSNTDKESIAAKLQEVEAHAEKSKSELEEASRKEISTLSAKITKMEAYISAKNSECDRLTERLDTAESELIAARQELDRIRGEFDNERSMLARACEDDAKALLEAKATTIASLEVRLNDAEAIIATHRSQIDELRKNNEKSVEHLKEEHSARVAKLEENLMEQRSETASLTAKNNEVVAQCKSFKVAVAASMEKTIKSHHQVLFALEQKLAVLSERLGNYEVLIRNSIHLIGMQQREDISALQEKVKNVSEHKDAVETALNGRIHLLEVEVKEGIEKLSAVRKQRDEARDNEEKSLRSLDIKSQEADELREQVQTLNDRLSTASGKVQELQEQMAQKNSNIHSLMKELETLSSECSTAKKQLQALQETETDRLQQEKTDTALFQKMSRDLSEKRDVIVQKNARIDELEKEVKRLAGIVERLESVLATKESQIAKLAQQSTSEGAANSADSAASMTAPVKSSRGCAKRSAKRKQDENEQEPSDSEIDAQTIQPHQPATVSSRTVADSAVEEDTEAASKRRRRRGALSKDEPSAMPEVPVMAKSQSEVVDLEQPTTTRSGKVGPCTRARARGRQRNNPQRDEQQEEDADENGQERPESVDNSGRRQSSRKRGADQSKNVQSHLLPQFDGNDNGSYV